MKICIHTDVKSNRASTEEKYNQTTFIIDHFRKIWHCSLQKFKPFENKLEDGNKSRQ